MSGLYKRITGVDLIEVDIREDYDGWVHTRTLGIGGSDAGTIMGCNVYGTKLSLYLAKKKVAGFSGNAHTLWGHIMEDPIREHTARELGVKIESVPGNFRSREHPFMLANLDGLIEIEAPEGLTIDGETVHGIGGHEIKTSSNGAGFGDGEVPDSYYWQVQHYMAVTGLDWFVLTAFFMHTKTARHYLIRQNEIHIAHLVKAEREFWENHVLADVPPEPEGGEREQTAVRQLEMYDDEVVLGDGYIEVCDEFQQVKEQMRELKLRESKLKNMLIMGIHRESGTPGEEEKAKVKARCGRYTITYNTVTKSSVDRDELRKAGLLDRYSKAVVSREMRISSKE